MGYGDCECIVCYLIGGPYDDYDQCKDICFSCMGQLLSHAQGTSRVHQGLVEHLKNGNYSRTECFLCKRRAEMTFYSPCCENHSGMYINSNHGTVSIYCSDDNDNDDNDDNDDVQYVTNCEEPSDDCDDKKV